MTPPENRSLWFLIRRGVVGALLAATTVMAAAWPIPATAGPAGTAGAGDEGDGVESPPPDTALRGVSRLPGIDVSKWQGDIDWQKVHDDGIRFVIARATRGNVVTDPKYAAFHHNAPAAGIRFTAYHYAMPSGRARDAEKEATHFLHVANLHKGNIVPALDLEDSGGLSRKRLAAWVGDWVAKVRAKIGTAPMIYTSPSFWRDHVGDTNRFARGGVRLWIAHWNVTRPDVPAGNWSGHGWTFWQHSDCGSVHGITGCVDEDRMSAGRFRGVTLP